MTCLRCKDERIIWVKDCYGRASAVNCSRCNKNGRAVKKAIKEWENGHFNDFLGKR
jgi:hypothetical protein